MAWGTQQWGQIPWGYVPVFVNNIVVKSILRDLINVTFTNEVTTNTDLTNAANYTVVDAATETISLQVIAVNGFDPEDGTVTSINLQLFPPPELDTEYKLTIVNLKNSNGATYEPMTDKFIGQLTKANSLQKTLSKMYSKDLGSNITNILLAIGIEDDKIGGKPHSTS
jgi:hypothetical protein